MKPSLISYLIEFEDEGKFFDTTFMHEDDEISELIRLKYVVESQENYYKLTLVGFLSCLSNKSAAA